MMENEKLRLAIGEQIEKLKNDKYVSLAKIEALNWILSKLPEVTFKKLRKLEKHTPIWILWRNHPLLDTLSKKGLRNRSIGFVTKVDEDSITIHQTKGRITYKIIISLCSIVRWGFVTCEKVEV